MHKFIIKSHYEYEIEANNEEEAIEKWSEIIEDELAVSNQNLASKFIDSLEVEKY